MSNTAALLLNWDHEINHSTTKDDFINNIRLQLERIGGWKETMVDLDVESGRLDVIVMENEQVTTSRGLEKHKYPKSLCVLRLDGDYPKELYGRANCLGYNVWQIAEAYKSLVN